MRFSDFMNESLGFVDLPELCRKWKNKYKCKLPDIAKLVFNGMQAKFSINELTEVYGFDIEDIVKFFAANGWTDCSKTDASGNYITDELIFRQSREPVDNVKPYYELELANNPDKLALYRDLLKKLDFSKFYHVSRVPPNALAKTTGLRCKNDSKVKFEKRIYMISGKMALKVLIIEDGITADTDLNKAQELLNDKLYELAEQMIGDIKIAWEYDHDEQLTKLYIYEIILPPNWPVYKDPEYDDEDELSACACFTIQNIPLKFIKYV